MLRNPFRNLDQKKLSRSSDILKTQNDYYKIVNRRIFIFSIVICLVFTTIAVRLVFVQIYDKESYTVKLENYSSNTEIDATSRGQILDRYGNVIAKTVASHNIIYFPPKGVTRDEQWTLAQKFSKQFHVTSENMTDSDYQDLYIFLHQDKSGKKDGGKNLLKESEKELTGEEQEKLIRSRVTKEMVDELADDEVKKAFVVYLAMRKLPNNQNKVVIEDANEEDVAFLTENKDQYQGFNVDLGSWKREYPYGDTLRDVLGGVTTSRQGVPAELKKYYEAKGYSLTSRVGKSGLEMQYEELLAGTPRVSEISYDEDGTALLNEISSGKKGYDLHLTIDIELQQKVDEIITDVLSKYAGTKGREKFKQATVVLLDPQTGDVLAMSSKYKDEKGEIQNYSSAAYLSDYQPGSVVKGATVYMALEEGAETRTSIEQDAPMKFKGTPDKSSFSPWGPVDAVKALQVSSNVYMFKSVIKLAGGTYVENEALNVSNEKWTEVQQTMRNYYSMFGLGIKTQLDVPNEATGFKDYSTAGGRLLDYSIGQYDSYTPIQLAQYVATIANGGKRLQPHLASYATEVNSDYKVMENQTNILGVLDGENSKENLQTVQDGFRACVVTGHCGNTNNLEEPVAAKTGTAEVNSYTNASLIGYAPYGGKAKVAFACSAPESSTNDSSVAANICGSEIMPRVLEEFFKKY